MNRKGRSLIPLIFLIIFYSITLFFILVRHWRGENRYSAMAEVIASEGCGEGKIGMYLISNTIKNRSEKWNKTPYKIVTQPNQYYGLTNPNKIQLYNQCKNIADELASKILELPDLTDGALYFRQPTEQKRRWHKTETMRYKNHIFYK